MLLLAATLRNRPDRLWASTDGAAGSVGQHTSSEMRVSPLDCNSRAFDVGAVERDPQPLAIAVIRRAAQWTTSTIQPPARAPLRV